MINRIIKNLWFIYLKFIYQVANRELYFQDFQIVETNLRIAFNSSYHDRQYHKLVKKILDRRLRSWINDYWNQPISYLSARQYILFSIFKWLQENHMTGRWARTYNQWYLRRKKKVWKQEQKKWSVFLRYFLNFRVHNLSIIREQIRQGKGVLLCAFHTGYYRVLADFLTAHGYRVKLLVDRNVYQKEFEPISQKLNAKKEYLSGNTFEFLIAEDPSVGLKILEAFRKNEIVLFFLDGNTGLGKKGIKADTTPFFNQKMYIRRGALQLAIKNGTPIVPVVSKWISQWVPQFSFLEPIEQLNSGFKLPQNALLLAQHLYAMYERAIRNDPTQWDQWFDCHRFWVNRAERKAAVSMNEFQTKKRELLHAVEKREKIGMHLREDQVNYFIGKRGIALVDLHSARCFEAGPFLGEFMPWLKQKKRTSLTTIISHWKKKFDVNTIVDSITRLIMMNYLEVKS